MRFLLILLPMTVLAGTESFDTTVRPFLVQNCYLCHSEKAHTADLNLEKYTTPASVDADRDVWERIIKRVQNGEMPPKGLPKPKSEDIEAVSRWLRTEFDKLDKNTKPDPGRVTARRLNRVEYNNTIRDLLALNVKPAENFPADDSGYGFDNIGDVLSLSPVLMEKYLDTADRISRMAVGADPLPKPTLDRYRGERIRNPARGVAEITPELEYSADWEFTIRVGGEIPPQRPVPTAPKPAGVPKDPLALPAQSGEKVAPSGAVPDPRPVPQRQFALAVPLILAAQVDNGEIRKFDIDTRGEKERQYDVRLPLAAGRHTVKAWIIHPTDAIPEADRNNREKSLVVDYFDVRGPYKPAEPILTPSQKAIFVCGHLDGNHTPACARKIVTHLARLAYRRPPTPQELQRLVHFVDLAQQQGDTFNQGLQLAIKAMLVSPQFLFRIETDPRPDDPTATHRISDFELATRLSYFLWSTMPDDELLTAAENKSLHKPEVLEAEVRRMLRDAKSNALIDNFAGQWLELRNIDLVQPDGRLFPMFNRELRSAMKQETTLFIRDIIQNDRSILDFIDGRYTYLNERLAKHYGIEGVTGPEFRRVELDGKQRSGILTQASILTVSSYPNRTSPVIRGKWLLENILNSPPPPPPPGTPSLDDKAVGKDVSLRQQLEKHRESALCASCHSRMDPLGFGLDNYDAIGRWRTHDGNFPIDSSGTLPSGRKFEGPAELKQILLDQKDKFAECLTDKMLTYALGRGMESYDEPAIHSIATDLAKNDYRFSRLVTDIVESMPFEMRRGDPGSTPAPKTADKNKPGSSGGKS